MTRLRTTLTLAGQGLRAWTGRHWRVAALGTLGTAALLGLATVLIPNPVFGRAIAPVWWNYPVWLAASVLTGLLIASYVTTPGQQGRPRTAQDKRSSALGSLGAIAAWFAVGCPVCNKIALLALGYSGAISYFAPAQLWARTRRAGAIVHRRRCSAGRTGSVPNQRRTQTPDRAPLG